MRRALLPFLPLILVALAGCGASGPVVRAVPHRTLAVCAASDCGTYSVTLRWALPTLPFIPTGYYITSNGSRIDSLNTVSSYLVKGMDCGLSYTLGVQAHDNSGAVSQVYATTYTSPSCGSAPANTSLPVATGGPFQGGTMTAQTGSWSQPATYSYQWNRCNAAGQSCSAISGATSSTYLPQAGDVGSTLDVSVTASNTSGSNAATSAVSPAVTTNFAPVAPASYTVPGGAVSVTDGPTLATALANNTNADIVLQTGTYTPSTATYFNNPNGDRLWAATLGGATLTAGVVCGGNGTASGCEIHGLAFNITSSSYTDSSNAAIHAWGSDGVGTKVYDTTINGNYDIDAGIWLDQVQGAVVQRVTVQQMHKYGLFLDDNVPQHGSTAYAQLISDVSVTGVHEASAGSSLGTAEFDIWIGDQVLQGVDRIDGEHGFMGGLWTGSSSHNTTFAGVTVTTTDAVANTFGNWQGTGIYDEHFTYYDTFENLDLAGATVAVGQSCEWNQGTLDNEACIGNTYTNGTINTSYVGNFEDQGTRGDTVSNMTYQNQSCAAIVNYNPYPGDGNTFLNNDYSGILTGAAQITTNHGC